MPTFFNAYNMSNYIKQKSINIFQNVIAEKVKNILYEKTEELLYNRAFTPKNYERTRDLINSISIKLLGEVNKNVYAIKIYYDTNKIKAIQTENAFWNQHMSTDNYNTDISEYIPLWMEKGHNGMYSQKPIEMVKESKNIINNTNILKEIFKKELKKNGLEAK